MQSIEERDYKSYLGVRGMASYIELSIAVEHWQNV